MATLARRAAPAVAGRGSSTEYRALLALLEGRLDEARGADLGGARDRGERAQSWNAAVTYRLQLYVLRRQQGRLEEVEDLVRRSVEEYSDLSDLALRARADRGGAGPRERGARRAGRARRRRLREPAVRRGVARQHGLLAETASTLGDAGGAPACCYELLLPVRRPRRGRLPGDQHRRGRALPRPAGDDAGALGRRRAPLRGRARDQRADRRPPLARAHPARLRAHAPRPRRARRSPSGRRGWPPRRSRATASSAWTAHAERAAATASA